jgi:hypothetical protein
MQTAIEFTDQMYKEIYGDYDFFKDSSPTAARKQDNKPDRAEGDEGRVTCRNNLAYRAK